MELLLRWAHNSEQQTPCLDCNTNTAHHPSSIIEERVLHQLPSRLSFLWQPSEHLFNER